MALAKCKECGKEVSTEADKCPNCGAPVKSKGSGCFSAIGVVIGFLILVGVIGSLLNTGDQSAPSINLEIIKGWTWEDEGDWTYIRGSVKNIGKTPVGYFEVRAEYKNSKGEVVDTAYTNSAERLNPGAAKKFEIIHRDSPEFKKAAISIGRTSMAN